MIIGYSHAVSRISYYTILFSFEEASPESSQTCIPLKRQWHRLNGAGTRRASTLVSTATVMSGFWIQGTSAHLLPRAGGGRSHQGPPSSISHPFPMRSRWRGWFFQLTCIFGVGVPCKGIHLVCHHVQTSTTTSYYPCI